MERHTGRPSGGCSYTEPHLRSRKISIIFEFRPFWPHTREYAVSTDYTAPQDIRKHERAAFDTVHSLRPPHAASLLVLHQCEACMSDHMHAQARHWHTSAQGCGGSPWLLLTPPQLHEPSLMYIQAPCIEFHDCATDSALVWGSGQLCGKSNEAWASASLRCETMREWVG